MPSDVEDESKNKLQGDSVPVDNNTTSEKDIVRRRTKTGCLTCRKRRIKCGEEHPICKNCIKSKRDCAGYNHPLIYKQHPPLNSRPSDDLTPTAGLTRRHGPYLRHDTFAHNFSTVQPIAATISTSSVDLKQYGGNLWVAQNGQYASQLHQTPVGSSSSTASNHRAFEWHEPFRSDASSFIPRTIQHINRADTLGVYQNTGEDVAARSDSISDGVSSSESVLLRPPVEAVYNNLGFIRRSTLTETLQQPAATVTATSCTSSFLSDAEDSDDPWDVEHEYNDIDPLSSNPDNSTDKDQRPGISSFTPELTSDANAPLMISRQFTQPFSPLFEERFRHIFTHFITVTGLRISALNRHDVSDTNDLSKTFWIQKLPTMATERPALAHAILALSAVHMAKLNIGSENTAIKHFTWALKRIGPVLGDSQRRHEVSTLATILLLGFYEVMSGDHARWSLHLSGAGKLIMEHDYTSMMRAITFMRRSDKAGPNFFSGNPLPKKDFQESFVNKDVVDVLCSNDWDVDQDLISRLMGTEVNYDVQSQRHPRSDIGFGSLEDWRALLELYWWYCRQSVFMSMLSGDPPSLPYSQWKFCPPRGPINDANKAHGTFDHLWLIIARLTDFGGRDRERKIAVMKTRGGQWVPVPGFLGPRPSANPNPSTEPATSQTQMKDNARPPSANEGRARKAKQASGPSPKQPTFYGMIPPPSGPVRMPSSYRLIDAQLNANLDASPEHGESGHPQDLHVQTQQALHEHSLITVAFDEFEAALGVDFQPLSISDIQISTPFGPALQYKSPMIATMWTFFYAGRILLRRMHPHSPPAAMMSAGVNAHVTHEYAQTIGKICGGLFAQHSYLLQAGHVDHFLSAAIMEVTLSLLFAAIQYQNHVQRGWTISKLNEIAQVIGWPTSAAVAAGCETFWTEAGLAGKGPPYIRTMDRNNGDERVNGKYRLPDHDFSRMLEMTPDEEHVSRFVNHDRHLIDKHTSTRAHWALGLLSVDEDLQHMSLDHT